jgi:hypothetical protein
MPLNHSTVSAPPVLNQTPIGVGFAVFAPFMASKKDRHERGFYQLLLPAEETRSALHGVLRASSLTFFENPKNPAPKILEKRVQLLKFG